MPTSGGGFTQGFNAQACVDVDTLLVLAAHATQQVNDKQQIKPALKELEKLPGELGAIGELIADSGYFSQANVAACEEAGIEPYIAVFRQAHNQHLEDRYREPDIIKSVIGCNQFLRRGLGNIMAEWKLVSLAWNLKRLHVLSRTGLKSIGVAACRAKSGSYSSPLPTCWRAILAKRDFRAGLCSMQDAEKCFQYIDKLSVRQAVRNVNYLTTFFTSKRFFRRTKRAKPLNVWQHQCRKRLCIGKRDIFQEAG